MSYFPQFLSGSKIAQVPFNVVTGFNNDVVDMGSGRRHSRANYGAGLDRFPDHALKKWALNYNNVTDAELTTLLAFWSSVQGPLGSFTLLDPDGNMVQYSELFSNAAWEKNDVVVDATGVDDPFGGSLATTMESVGTNGNMVAYVVPDGSASGFVITGSVWVRAQSGGQQLAIGFVDSGFSVLASKTVSIPTSWRRISITTTLATSSNIRLLIGGFGTWNSTQIDMFGAQCVPAPGPGGYVKSPTGYGIKKCRFSDDALKWRRGAKDENSFSLNIQEIA